MKPNRVNCFDCNGLLVKHARRRSWYCEPCAQRRILIRRAVRKARIDAFRRGEITRLHASGLQCVDCGHSASAFDHRDYAFPLVVDPVCHGCNFKRGPAALPKEAA